MAAKTAGWVAGLAGMVLSPYVRAGWEHEFHRDRALTVALQVLPGSGFTVAGAPAVADAARVAVGAKLDITRTISAYVSFDGAFAGEGNAYAGKGGSG